MASNNKVAIYIRVSTLHQIDKDSLPMQRQDLIAYSKLMLNTDDYVIFEDAGYSGKNTDRPKFQEMMRMVRTGAFTHILVWKIDRISRNLLDFASMYQELKDLGVVFVSKNEQFDTSTAMGEAMLKIILVFAELERNMTSERVSATMLSRAANGQWNGGRVPFGYEYDPDTMTFSINDAERDIVVMIHDLYEEYKSLVHEARELNTKGYRSRAGYEWTPSTIMIILKSVFYCGDYRYNVLKGGNRQKVNDESEWVTVENHHPAIVSREQKERIIAMLKANARLTKQRGTHQRTKHVHIFQGMCLCSHCNKFMSSTISEKKSNNYRYSKYLCPNQRLSNCPGKSTSDPIVGEFVFNYILNMLNAQKRFSGISDIAELERQLLIGNTFSHIDHIEHDGLQDLYDMLSQGTDNEIYKKQPVKVDFSADAKELSNLRNEKQKLERAVDRLRTLYLYSDDAISETEYVIQRKDLTDKLDEVNERIGLLTSDDWANSISDEVFIERASHFVLEQKLANRNYVNFKRLTLSLDAEILKSFVRSVIDSISIRDGKVERIIFKNGLSHTFVFK